jgi:hypothetical protein
MTRTAAAGALAAAALLLSGCGSQPAPLTAMPPDAPADLCSSVPDVAKSGLQTSSDTDTTGDPTAACSLRSAAGVKPEVRGVVTWLLLDDDDSADGVLASQCRSIDTTVYHVQPGLAVNGADKTCGGSGKLGPADAATLAAVKGRAVVTVRWSAVPRQSTPAFARSEQVMQAVLQSAPGGS